MKLPRRSARTHAAGRLSHGSGLLLRRWEQRLTAWVRAGRRDDLDGWRAALGPLVRIVLLAAAGIMLFGILRAARGLMWIATAWWVLAAWRAGKPAEAPQEQPADPAPDTPDPDPIRTLLEDLIGDRTGVHLSTLLAHLQERGHHPGWGVADLRSRLPTLGVPVRRSVKVAGRVAYGVHRDDLRAPSPGAPPVPPVARSTPRSTCGATAHLPPSTEPSTRVAEHFDSGVKTL